jgi:ADP-ribosylglycohydrolase
MDTRRCLRVPQVPIETTPRELADTWGSSAHVVESVRLAVFAAQASGGRTFESVIRGAVQAGGDTDTVASIAGQIAGTWTGIAGLHGPLLMRIREIAETKRVAERFADLVGK